MLLTLKQETHKRNNILVNSLMSVIDDTRHEIMAEQLADRIEADLADDIDLSFEDVGGGLVPSDQSPAVVANLLSAHTGRYVHIDAATATKAWRKELSDISEYRLSYVTAPSGIIRICIK
jgi:hypothetical protein